ncbi:MAG: hypothetical protein ACT4PO_04810 [Actinomycetota bacterium]
MGSVYVVVYVVAKADDLVEARYPTQVTTEFAKAIQRRGWPYDVGDDPSFFCARRFSGEGGAITWGICRQDIRGGLAPGDTVVFLGYRRHKDGTVDYRFCGYATVAEKITQADIWEQPSRSVYRRYLNLLISPSRDGGFAHRESHPGRPHPDWLWRLTCSKGHSWRATHFADFEDPECRMRFSPGSDRAANGEPIEPCTNYVIFSKDSPDTFVAADPPVVAYYDPAWGPARPERWLDSAVARAVWSATLGQRPGRSLRLVANDPSRKRVQQRHRHIRIPEHVCESGNWRERMSVLVADLGVQPIG